MIVTNDDLYGDILLIVIKKKIIIIIIRDYRVLGCIITLWIYGNMVVDYYSRLTYG